MLMADNGPMSTFTQNVFEAFPCSTDFSASVVHRNNSQCVLNSKALTTPISIPVEIVTGCAWTGTDSRFKDFTGWTTYND